MTSAYGTFTVYGIQSGLASTGPQSLGPLLIPFSACQNISNYTFPNANSAVFDVPGSSVDTVGAPAPNGVWIIPSNGSATTLSIVLTAGDTPFHISPVNPTFIAFDPNNIPTSFELATGAAMTVAIQYV